MIRFLKCTHSCMMLGFPSFAVLTPKQVFSKKSQSENEGRINIDNETHVPFYSPGLWQWALPQILKNSKRMDTDTYQVPIMCELKAFTHML